MDLLIWSAKKPDLAPLKVAKAQIRVEDLIVPKAVPIPDGITAGPGPDDRVLAIGSRPPWITNYALCHENTSEDGWRRALAWVLGLAEFDPKATTWLDVVGALFGASPETGLVVREITAEEQEAEIRMHEYATRTDETPTSYPVLETRVVVMTPEQNHTWRLMALRAGVDIDAHLNEEERITVLEPAHEVPVSEMPQTPRSLAQRAAAVGWRVMGIHSRSHHAATLYASNSEEGAKKEYAKGDVKFPAEDREYWRLDARLDRQGVLVAAIRLRYESRPAETKTGLATAFEWGEFYDPINQWGVIFPPSTIYGTQGKNPQPGWSYIPDNALTPAEFAEWFDTLVPPTKKRKAADTRRPEEKMNDGLLAGEEWS